MQTNDAGDAGQSAALENLVPDLERLERLLAEENAGQVKTLESFAADADLQRLEELAERQRNEFDALDFVGRLRLGSGSNLWSDEEFHSNLLAWLLNPRESHGIGERFLTNFVKETCAPSEVQSTDWTHARIIREWPNEVDGEWGYLDILILNESGQTLCAIENKVFSSEHSEQLTRYRKALTDSYPDFTRHHVFLTPRGTRAYREEEREYWTPATYAMVLDVVSQIVNDIQNPVKEDLRSFLSQYATTLRRNIVSETSVRQLARQIYMEHKDAVDLIIQHKPNYIEEMKQEFRVAIGEISGWSLDCEDSGFLRFRSLAWNDFEIQETGTGWLPRSSALILFQINFRDGVMNLPYFDVGLSPAPDETFRRRPLDNANNSPGLFAPRDRSYRSGWIVLDQKEYILEEADLKRWDDPSVLAKIHAWVNNFAENRFPAMNEVIVNCLREYEAGRQSQNQ